jgi:hypothetical protein
MTTTAAEKAVLGRRWERATEWLLMVAPVVFLRLMPCRSFAQTLRAGCSTHAVC